MASSPDTAELDRQQLADLIVRRLESEHDRLRAEFATPGRIPSCIVDDLLPDPIARKIRAAFPDPARMTELRSLREHKRIAAQMNLYHPLLEETVFAFQDPRVVRLCESITGIRAMVPDEQLYAGGISLMAQGDFLNPHLDNSHDNARERYRVLNLLYYVSPGWTLENGGNLELWDNGMQAPQRTLVSAFNRLALMITNRNSYHSVSKVQVPDQRCCVSNYYFSDAPVEDDAYFHVTSFYGRPDDSAAKTLVLRADRGLRGLLRRITRSRLLPTRHIYRKPPHEE